MKTLLASCFVAALTLSFVPAEPEHENLPSLAQVVALDECDPVTFNAALGPPRHSKSRRHIREPWSLLQDPNPSRQPTPDHGSVKR